MTRLPNANRPDLTSWCPCWSMCGPKTVITIGHLGKSGQLPANQMKYTWPLYIGHHMPKGFALRCPLETILDLWFGLSNLLIVFTSGTLLHLSFHDTCQLVRLFLQLTGQLICFCRVSVRPLVGLCSLLWQGPLGLVGHVKSVAQWILHLSFFGFCQLLKECPLFVRVTGQMGTALRIID